MRAQYVHQVPTPLQDRHNVMIATQDISQEAELQAVPLVRSDNTQKSEKRHVQTVLREHTPTFKVLPLVWTVNPENSQD